MALPWRLAIFGAQVEKGWPHTHGTVVCLPMTFTDRSRSALVELLIHERIHILQRLHPQATREFIRVRYGPNVAPIIAREIMGPSERNRIYANPDVDSYEYNGDLDRHPYEMMAYDLAAYGRM